MAKFWTSRTAVITGVAITFLGAFYVYQSPTTINYTMSRSTISTAYSEAPGLEFQLAQVSRHPPALLVTVKNKSPDTTYTILKWGTPLDSAALNTGLFKIIDVESKEEVHQVTLQINRKMPPPQEELATLAPGTEEEIEVVFDKPWMPERKPAKYKITAAGEFTGLWDKYGNELTEDDLNVYSSSPFSGKKFKTNEVIMDVH